MSRVPEYPPKPIRPILTLQDHLDAGLTLRSFCSSGQGHNHVVDLVAEIEERGPYAEVDYAFKLSLTCPICGAPGGGIEIVDQPRNS